MKVIDFIVLGLAVFFMIRGLLKGFLGQLFGVIGTALVAIATANLYQFPAKWMSNLIVDENTRLAVALIATGAVLFLVYKLITMLIVKLVTKNKGLGALNRVIGMVLGVAIVYVFTAIVVSLLFNTDDTFLVVIKKTIKPIFEGSWTATKLYSNNFFGDWIVQMIVEKFQSALPTA